MFRTVFLVFWTLLCHSSALQNTHHVARQSSNPPLDHHPLLTEAKFLPFHAAPSQPISPKIEHLPSSPPEDVPPNQPVSFVPTVFSANKDYYENRNLSTRIFGPRGFSFGGNDAHTKAVAAVPSDLQPTIFQLKEAQSDEETVFVGPRNLSIADFAPQKSSTTLNLDMRDSAVSAAAHVAVPFRGNGQLKQPAPRLQEIRTTDVKEHSPKKDVEVFAPLAPAEGPPQTPPVPMPPPMYPGLFPDAGGMFPNFEPSPFNPEGVGDNPLYPSFVPEEPPQFIPNTEQPPIQPTEEVTRATEETTRQTEETTHRTPPTTTRKIMKPTFHYTPNATPPSPPVAAHTPFVPLYTPYVPKYTPYVPRRIPFVPNNTPYVPKNVPFTYGTSSTRYFNMYPPTTKTPKVPPPIWPQFTPRPLVSASPQPVIPFAAKLVSAAAMSTTTATVPGPSVEVIGEPAEIEPKYKLAVVSDYQNYNQMDGSFGFSIDLENGITAKVRGYKKNGKHVIEGSYSLFANEGEPVNITYMADNDDAAVQRQQQDENAEVPNSDDTAEKPTEEPNPK